MAQLRVPLNAVEQARPVTAVVTGASGYVAGAIVQRLLAAGHTVHATVRNPAHDASVSHLKSLHGAQQRLKFYAADLLTDGSFDEAVQDAEVVFHTASPFINTVKKGEERSKLIDPAVKGTENVLAAVAKAQNVRRVVLTSSVVAAYGDPHERGKDHVFTGADWNTSSTETFQPYSFSKLQAERRAWEIAEKQDRYQLVTVLPGFVMGPMLSSRSDGESVGMIKGLLQGRMWPAAPRFGFSIVDVDDLAAAHCLAAFTPGANGRYLVAPEFMWLKQMGDALKRKYPDRKLPVFGSIPGPLLQLLAPILGLRRDFITSTLNKEVHFDCKKAQRELGLTFHPVEQTLNDMAEAALRLGVVS